MSCAAYHALLVLPRKSFRYNLVHKCVSQVGAVVETRSPHGLTRCFIDQSSAPPPSCPFAQPYRLAQDGAQAANGKADCDRCGAQMR